MNLVKAQAFDASSPTICSCDMLSYIAAILTARSHAAPASPARSTPRPKRARCYGPARLAPTFRQGASPIRSRCSRPFAQALRYSSIMGALADSSICDCHGARERCAGIPQSGAKRRRPRNGEAILAIFRTALVNDSAVVARRKRASPPQQDVTGPPLTRPAQEIAKPSSITPAARCR